MLHTSSPPRDGRTELVSRRFRSRLMEAFVGHYILREIRTEFEDAGIAQRFGAPSVEHRGERRALVQSFYDAIDFREPGAAARFMGVAASVLRRLHRLCEDPIYGPSELVRGLMEEARACGWEYRDGVLVGASVAPAAPCLVDARALAESLDLPHLRQQLARVDSAVATDPDLAIGGAKEIVETVCKTILRERNVGFGPREEVQPLARKAFSALRQLPEDVPEAAKGAEVIRIMLQHLAAVPQSMAELRNMYGTGHGRDGKARGLQPRHARLAAGVAATLATYLLETHLADSEAGKHAAA